MLLAQINRDSQGMAEFHDADGQQVTLCLTEAVTVAGELNSDSGTLSIPTWEIHMIHFGVNKIVAALNHRQKKINSTP